MVSSELFELGQTPVVLQGIGEKNLLIVMGQNVMLKMTGEKHSISLDEIAQLTDAIADPIMVFKSATVGDAFVILTELTDKNGDDVVVALHLERFLGFNKINRISSVYGKENVGSFVEKQISDGNLRYIEKNKSREWFRSRGLYLPKLNTILDFDNSILEKSDIVNRFGEKNISQNANFVDTEAKHFTRRHSDKDIAFAEQLSLSRGYTLETFYDEDISIPAMVDKVGRVVRLNLASYRDPVDLLGHELFHTLSEADQQSLARYFKLNAKTDTEEFKAYKEKTMRDYQKANDNTTNKLHVVISTSEVTGIKKSRGQGITWDRSKETAAHYSRPAFDISIADLFANVNPLDVDFLKYVPNGFLNEEQLTAKEKGVKKTEAYIAKKNERYASPITISTTEEAHAADIGFEEPDYNDNLDFFVDNEASESVESETSSALDRIMGKVSENKKKADKEKGVNQGYVKDKKRKISITAEGLKEAIAQQTRTLRYIPERGEQGTFFAEARKTNCLLKKEKIRKIKSCGFLDFKSIIQQCKQIHGSFCLPWVRT